MGVAELTGKYPDAGKEVLAAARHTEEFRQLRHGDAERGPGFKPHQNCFADEIDQGAQPQRPRQHTHTGDQQGRESGDARPAHGITTSHARHGHTDEQGDCRRRTDGQLPRGAEQSIQHTAEQIPIDTVLRWQPGQ